MKEYIATFHTHLSALMTSRSLTGLGIQARMMPVPRKLSSSCGTCVRFIYEGDIQEYAQNMEQDDLDTVYLVENDEYLPQYHAKAE